MNWFGKKTGSSVADVTDTATTTVTLPASAQWVSTTDSISIDYSSYATNMAVSNYSFVQPKRAIDELFESSKIAKKFYLPLTTILRGVVLVDVFSLKRIFKSYDGDIALPVEKFTPVHVQTPQPDMNYTPVTSSGVAMWTTYSTAWYSSSEHHELSNPGGRANGLLEPTIISIRI